MNASGKNWLAAYLYYAEPWEKLLVEAVDPFVNEVFEQKWADQFFFIRYWEKGPHIRLRFKGSAGVLENETRSELQDHFARYYQSLPSAREEPSWEDIEEEHVWFPNNSVQFIDYEPETERYGGPVGILIAEKQFELSSRVILEIIKRSDNWSYDRALGAGIQMHLAFAHSLGMDLHEVKTFFRRVFENWFGWGTGIYGFGEKLSEKEIRDRQDATLKAFREQFALQKSQLIPFHQSFWEALGGDGEFEEAWLNNWTAGMAKIGDELRVEQKSQRLIYPPRARSDKKLKVSGDRQLLWSILFSYVHMTNNRLGIKNRDEAYLGYLIKESLESL